MIQIGNKTADAYYVGSKLVSQIYKGSTKIYPLENQIPKSIKDSMMLWYDIKRQGATNESMEANPKLIDLSGNGHDITCYNFAWIGMSSVGGYYFDSLHGDAKTSGEYTYNVSEDFTKFTFLTSESATRENFFSFVKKIEGTEHVHYTFRVTGLTEFKKKYPNAKVTTGNPDNTLYDDGEMEVTQDLTDVYTSVYLNCEGGIPVGESINVAIEQIPEYPNALVADGVDDYALVEGLPLLTKDRGFTVIYKRTILGDPNDAYKVFAAKRQGTQDAEHWGAFVLEKGPNVYPFGQINEITINTDDIGYMTPTSYCGQPIQAGNQVDYDHLALFCGADDGNEKQSVALYSFILFNRTLTNDEIDWVKTNLIEGDTEL